MGMFDEIRCDYPLPGDPPAFAKVAGHLFQTKDLDCELATYTINVDGQFSYPDFTGEIEFHSSNVVASGPGIYTENGEDAESVEYVAQFDKSRLTGIREASKTREPALPASAIRKPIHRLTDQDIYEIERRRSESLLGRTMYVLWGGQEKGYMAEVVAEGPKQWCLRLADGKLELMDRFYRDHIIWDSEAEALSHKDARRSQWEMDRKKYEDYAASRK